MDTHEALQIVAAAEAADAGLRGLDARSWRARVESSLDDFRSAFELLLDRDPHAALRMAAAMAQFWRISGQIPEGRAWLDRSLAIGDRDQPVLPRALYESALLAFWQGDDDASRSLLERSLDAATRLGDLTGEAVALCGMARMALREGDLDRAQSLCEQAVERVEGTDDRLGRSNAFHVLGVTAQMRGNFDEARVFMNRRLVAARELGHLSSVAMEASNLSVVERQAGNLQLATELAHEALQLSERRGDEWMIPFQLSSLASIAAARNDFGRAARLLGAAAGMMERMGTAWPPDEKPHFERTRSAAKAALPPDEFERAWTEGRRMSAKEAVALGVSGNQKSPG